MTKRRSKIRIGLGFDAPIRRLDRAITKRMAERESFHATERAKTHLADASGSVNFARNHTSGNPATTTIDKHLKASDRQIQRARHLLNLGRFRGAFRAMLSANRNIGLAEHKIRDPRSKEQLSQAFSDVSRAAEEIQEEF